MTDSRRRRIRAAIKELQSTAPDAEMVEGILSNVLDEETGARDNTLECFQETDAYIIREESCDFLDEAIGVLDAEDPDTFADAVEALSQIDGV